MSARSILLDIAESLHLKAAVTCAEAMHIESQATRVEMLAEITDEEGAEKALAILVESGLVNAQGDLQDVKVEIPVTAKGGQA